MVRWIGLMVVVAAFGCAKGGNDDGPGRLDATVGDGGAGDQGVEEPDLGPECISGDCCATAADCSDGVGCTRDECMVASGECVNTPVDADCPDGTMCVAGMGCRLDVTCEFDTDCPEPPAENNQLTRCSDAMCELLCEDGFVDFDEDGTNGCECDSSGDDRPDLMFEDTNCDGIDGDEARAIFVDGASGSDSSPGTRAMPKASIQAGIDTAAGMGLDVYVSEGTYAETLDLASGVGVYGGYQASMGWARAVTAVVDISGGTTAVAGDSVNGVVLQLLSIRSANGAAPGESSVALRFASSSDVTLEGLSAEAGAGANGRMGVMGTTGASVVGTGGIGQPGCEDSGGVLCSGCSQPQGGSGGVSPCGRTGGRGGNAGKGGGSGAAGDPGAGGTAGGPGGVSRGDGSPGSPGASGGSGTDGGAGASYGSLGASGYVGAAGGDGTDGTHGNGGGGGGGGGGGTTSCDSYGSSGGGGGGGGCAGTAATGGGGGGASIALLLFGTDVAITDTELSTSTGGRGGPGGPGGPGGTGGGPGNGGAYGGSGEQDDGGAGARGGGGGAGGRGGHGGGGGGGPSVGIACGGGASLTSNARNNFSLGAAGDGGASSAQVGLRGVQVNRQGC